MKITIYGLTDPETKEIRYIGRTSQKLYVRKCQHHDTSSSNHGSHKIHWINQLKKKGLKAGIVAIKELDCTWEESHIIECMLIKEYIENGYRLTNLDDKGAGWVGIKCVHKHGEKPVLQYGLDGVFISEHNSLANAAIAVGGRLKGIYKGLNECNTAYGYQWKYKVSDIYDKIIEPIVRKSNKKSWVKVIQLTPNDEIIKVWDSVTQAKNATGARNISSVCNGLYKCSKGFKWKYFVEDIN